MSGYPLITHRRDRDASIRFLRMATVSLLIHGLVIFSATLYSRRSSAHSFRESSILVTFHESPKTMPGPPAAAVERVPSPAVPAKPAPAQAVSTPKTAPQAPAKSSEKVIPKDPTKSEIKTGGKSGAEKPVPLTKAEQASMDAALLALRRQVAGSEQGAEAAEWNAAMAAIGSSLQSRAYHQQAGQVLADAWTPPIGVAGNLSVRVLVKLRGDGTILGWTLIQSSGDAALDASVERLFQKVTKLDPIPWANPGETLDLPIEFRPGSGEN
jgi:TonB family protein